MQLQQLSAKISTLHRSVLQRERMNTKTAVQIGKLLTKAKDLCRHGELTGWIEDNCGFTHRQANRYMKLYEFSKMDTVSTLGLTEAYLQAGILKPSNPAEIVKQARRITLGRALIRKANVLERRKKLIRHVSILDGTEWQVLHGDMLKESKRIESNSIPVCITDPDYLQQNYAKNYQKLGAIAKRVLINGGDLLTFAPHPFLPEIIAILQKAGLTYQWTLCYYMPGVAARMWDRKLLNQYSPILWFTNGARARRTDFISDTIVSDGKDKTFHEWGKSVKGIEQIIKSFSRIDDVILDTSCGGGSVGVAALNLNRRFIGVDIDKDACRITASRLHGMNKRKTGS